MTRPNPKKQKVARDQLKSIFMDASNVWIIHYSCENFYNRPHGASPRITSIAVRKIKSGQTISFSIHQVAERQKVSFDQIGDHYDSLERAMLDEFFIHVGSHRGMKYLHWNMRDINFGFAAIEHRYKVLDGIPVVVDDDKKFDLARLLINIYGDDYTDHPRLETLLKKNSIKPRDFLTGPKEAEAFELRNFVALHQSTLRKVDVIANIAEKDYDQTLKTNTSWWDMHGGRARYILEWFVENKIIAFIASIASVIGLVLAVYTLR